MHLKIWSRIKEVYFIQNSIMKIGIDASRANVINKTGTEWYSYRLIQEFKKIADRSDQFFLYSKEKLNGDLNDRPVNFHSKVLNWPPRYLWTQLRLSGHFVFNETDVLFVPAHTLPLRHPKKTVLTVHDIGFERFETLYSGKSIGSGKLSVNILSAGVRLFTLGRFKSNELDYHRWSMKQAIKSASHIIVPSKFTKSEIIKVYNIPESNISVIYHGVDTDNYRPINDGSTIVETLNKYKINEKFILYIGRLEEKKNTNGLIKSFARLKKQYKVNHKLVLVGQPGYNFENIRRSILQNNLAKDIIMPGYVQYKDLAKLLNAAECFVFPSYYEGFGLPVLEAMACDCPVIASNYSSLPEICGQAAQLVNPKNIEDLASTIYKVLINEPLREEMKRRGRKWIKNFSWASSGRKTLETIKKTAIA